MISVFIRFDLGNSTRIDFRSTYRQLVTILKRLPGNHRWLCGVNSPRQKPIPFEDEAMVLPRLHERADLMGITSFNAAISSDSKRKREPGFIEIEYSAAARNMTVSVHRPDQAWDSPTGTVADILLAVLEGEPGITFAFADVYDKVDGAFKYYRTTYATFPHRKCLGWMAYVPETVSREQLPLAAAILPAPGGSIIVSVNEAFNLADRRHIQRANQIEMDMSDLGLLPVTDPTF